MEPQIMNSVDILATSYPLWLTIMLWVLLFSPTFPGLILLGIAVAKAARSRPGAVNWALSGSILLAIGIGGCSWLWRHVR